jgi:hypothetical protein
MLAEFLTRLAVALPLVCAAAVLSLVAVKRGWLRWPLLPGLLKRPTLPATTGDAALAVIAVKSLTPAARVAVVRFQGREHLIGVGGGALTLLASEALPEPARDGLPTARPSARQEFAA